MPLAAGDRIGPYEVLGPLAAGGMGEVYRARDSRLGRVVALKVLPAPLAKDEDRLRRFEQEARAAGTLNHPNILGLLDVGQHDGSPFLVSELLEGASLRTLLLGGTLPLRKALDYAAQIARGLAAAHDQGILHRDLKPDNLFVGKDGRVKILDFGLAKLTRPAEALPGETHTPTVTSPTTPGTVLGTVGYMSPEQVRGLPTDARSDIFSFGAVLFEMLSGQRAFKGPSAVETMNAILKEDPPELSGVAPALERTVRRCLEKNPDERFRSAHDLGFALEALSGSAVRSADPSASSGGPDWLLRVGLGLALLGLPALGFWWGRARSSVAIPTFRQLTFGRGASWSARFAHDGSTVVYGARWNDQPFRIFSTRPETAETAALPIPDADLLAVSSQGELALALHRPERALLTSSLVTLATVPLGGGEPREVARDVQSADYSPDGARLAIVRSVSGRQRLEYPIGKILYETPSALASVRVSPDGRRLAVFEGQGDGAKLLVFDPAGGKTVLGGEKRTAITLAWAPGGRELWLGSWRDDDAVLEAVDLRGRTRTVASLPGLAHVQDVSLDGRVLMIGTQRRSGIRYRLSGDPAERDFPTLAATGYPSLSADGRVLLFSDRGVGGQSWVYVRRTDSSSGAVRLGPGKALAISPDGRLAFAASNEGKHVILPVGLGEPRTLEGGFAHCHLFAQWFPDGRRVLLDCRSEGARAGRAYVQAVDGSASRAFTPEGTECWALSPDGKEAACKDADGKGWVYPVEEGAARPLAGLEAGEYPLQWSADGKSLLVTAEQEQRLPRRIHRLELASGRRSLFQELLPADTAGILNLDPFVTPDGGSYAYIYGRMLSDLYVVEGLR